MSDDHSVHWIFREMEQMHPAAQQKLLGDALMKICMGAKHRASLTFTGMECVALLVTFMQAFKISESEVETHFQGIFGPEPQQKPEQEG